MQRRVDFSQILVGAVLTFLSCAVHDEIRRGRGEADKCILPAIAAGLKVIFFGS